MKFPTQYEKTKGADGGIYVVPFQGRELYIIASNGAGWEHVSVSLNNRCPNWPEMCFVKDLFWSEEETVMQLHPPKSEYVNMHPFCLHLWRPLNTAIPLPDSLLVGFK